MKNDPYLSRIKLARMYMRASTKEQDVARQEWWLGEAKKAGFHIAGVYRENAPGAIRSRPELQRLLNDLQPHEYVIAESTDRISRLPYHEAEALITEIENKPAYFWLSDVMDFEDMIANAEEGTTEWVFLTQTSKMMRRFALVRSRKDYEQRRQRQEQGIANRKAMGGYKGKQPNVEKHKSIIRLRKAGISINQTAKDLSVSRATVTNVWKAYKQTHPQEVIEEQKREHEAK